MNTFSLNNKSSKRKFDLKKPEAIALFELFQKTLLQLKSNQILFKKNTLPKGIYYISKGTIKIVTTDAKGKEIILQNSQAGSLLGLNALMKGKQHYYSALASVSSEILFISKKDFMQLLSSNPVVSKYILINLCKQLEDTESIIEEYYSENESRIAEALVILTNSKQADLLNSHKISVSSLSGITSIAAQQTKQILIDFEERKLVIVNRNIIISANIEELKILCKIKKQKITT